MLFLFLLVKLLLLYLYLKLDFKKLDHHKIEFNNLKNYNDLNKTIKLFKSDIVILLLYKYIILYDSITAIMKKINL